MPGTAADIFNAAALPVARPSNPRGCPPLWLSSYSTSCGSRPTRTPWLAPPRSVAARWRPPRWRSGSLCRRLEEEAEAALEIALGAAAIMEYDGGLTREAAERAAVRIRKGVMREPMIEPPPARPRATRVRVPVGSPQEEPCDPLDLLRQRQGGPAAGIGPRLLD